MFIILLINCLIENEYKREQNEKNGKKSWRTLLRGGLLIFSGSWRTLFFLGGVLIPCWHYRSIFLHPETAIHSRNACHFFSNSSFFFRRDTVTYFILVPEKKWKCMDPAPIEMAAVVETARNDNVTQFLFANHGALWARVFPNVPEATLLLPLPSRNFCKIFAKVSLNISKLNRDEYCVHKLLSQIISYFSKLRKNDCKVILKQKWPSSCTIPTRTFWSTLILLYIYTYLIIYI